MTGVDIVAEARQWIDTPWHHNQSTKGVGRDCIGLLVGVARPFGLADDWTRHGGEFHAYAEDPDPKKLLRAVAQFFDQISVQQARPGDILLFRLVVHPKHFGIIVSTEPRITIVHAYKSAERVTEMPLDDTWVRLIHSAHRYRSI